MISTVTANLTHPFKTNAKRVQPCVWIIHIVINTILPNCLKNKREKNDDCVINELSYLDKFSELKAIQNILRFCTVNSLERRETIKLARDQINIHDKVFVQYILEVFCTCNTQLVSQCHHKCLILDQTPCPLLRHHGLYWQIQCSYSHLKEHMTMYQHRSLLGHVYIDSFLKVSLLVTCSWLAVVPGSPVLWAISAAAPWFKSDSPPLGQISAFPFLKNWTDFWIWLRISRCHSWVCY